MKTIRSFLLVIIPAFLLLPILNLLGINGKNDYISVKPSMTGDIGKVSMILQNKCVDCHSPGMSRMPIYSNFPIAKQLIEHNIREGIKRFILDTATYSGEKPFTPQMLARLEHVVQNDKMPPVLYLSMHWDGRLSTDEKETILKWIASERAKNSWNMDSANAYQTELVQPLPLTVDLDMEKVALGEKLFHETLLSADKSISCASCHDLSKGGTDQSRVSVGMGGQLGMVNTPTVYNAMYSFSRFWDGQRVKGIHNQAAVQENNSKNKSENWEIIVNELKRIADYKNAFLKLYPDQGITKTTIIDAIACFEQSLVTPNSRFDQYLRGDTDILNNDEKEGYSLFKHNCSSCHFGPLLGGLSYEKMGVTKDYFKMRGGKLTKADNGRFNVTGNENDRYVFRVLGLRNIELTYPYFHDGSVNDLFEAVRIMGEVQLGIKFSDEETLKIVAFLKTLTGEYKGKALINQSE